MKNAPKKYCFEVTAEFSGYRIHDYIVKQVPEFTEGTVKKMLYERVVRKNGEIADISTKIKVGDMVEIKLSNPQTYQTSIPKFPLLYEDNDFLVVDKPYGVPVVAERWNQSNVFKQFIIQHLQSTNQANSRPNIVHRIDKDASGIVLVAKTIEMERYLSTLFEQHTIHKEYLAVVAGVLPQEGCIRLKIAKVSRHENRMMISEFGKDATTYFRVLEGFRDFALVQIRIETGRTHQVRIHLSSQGYPLAIDPTYGYRNCMKLSDIKITYRPNGEEKPLISRLTLHAWRVSFPLPNGQHFEVESELPDDMKLLIKMLRKYRGGGASMVDLSSIPKLTSDIIVNFPIISSLESPKPLGISTLGLQTDADQDSQTDADQDSQTDADQDSQTDADQDSQTDDLA